MYMTFKKRLLSLIMAFAILINLGLGLPAGALAEKTVRKADIYFVLDSTGSMSSYISSVVRNLSVFITRLTENNIDLRMCLIDYRDVTTDSVPLTIHTFDGGYWTSSEAAIKAEIQSIRITGGGDEDETPTDALMKIPAGRTDASKFVFLLTDANYKRADGRLIPSMEAVIAKFKAENVSASVVSKMRYEGDYRSLYQGTNGIFIDINSADYSELMLQIADWIEDSALELIHGEFNYLSFSGTKDASTDFYYSDAYFYEDSTYYNNHLATMSLDLALSISSTLGKSVKTLQTSEWKNKTKNIEALFETIGFERFKRCDELYAEPDVNTIGVVAASKKIELKKKTGESDTSTLIALVVRGTGYYNEWGGNFNVGSSGTHTGFTICRDKVLSFLKQYIQENGISGRIKLWITGYSRAGATTNMVAGALDSQMRSGVLTGSDANYLPSGVTLAFNELYAYPFEPPMGITKSMASNYSNIHNNVNIYDPVPKVAMEAWGFSRYNKDGGSSNNVLPNLSSKNYASALKAMKTQYSQILSGQPSGATEGKEYNISEYAYSAYIKAEYNILFGLQLSIDGRINKSLTVDKLLYTLLNDDFAGTIGSRSNYVSDYQSAIIPVLADGLGLKYDGDFEAYLDQLISLFKEILTGENLVYIYSPLLNPTLKFDKRVETVDKRMNEVIEKAVNADMDRTVDSAHLLALAEAMIPLIAEIFVSDPDGCLSAIYTFKNSNVAQAHFPEVTLAWLRSQDSFYTESPINVLFPNILRILRINCPVNVMVYDSDGRTVAEIIDNKPTSIEYVGCDINENDEMVITLPADETYRVEITPTDDGTMNFAVEEYNELYGDYSRLLNYYSVPIEEGNKLYADIPAISETDCADAHKASTANYRLTQENGEVIAPSQEIKTPTDAGQYEVAVAANNAGGLALGGGRFVSGSFCKITAVPMQEGSFLGWYEGDKLISKELSYRFPVTGDRSIVAKFVQPQMVKLETKATEGGFIFDWSSDYPAGTTLKLHAEPDPGYKFTGWAVEKGSVSSDLSAADAYFTVQEDTVLKAIFVSESAVSYSFTAGEGSSWTKGSKEGLSFTVDGASDLFDSILVDNKVVAANQYTVEGPKVKIQLKPAFLETLSVGTHTIKVRMKNGECSTNFSIVDNVPHTGDDAHIAEWGAFGLGMLLVLTVIVIKVRKKEAAK